MAPAPVLASSSLQPAPRSVQGVTLARPLLSPPFTTLRTNGAGQRARVGAEGRQALPLWAPACGAELASGVREDTANTPPLKPLPALQDFVPYFSQHLKTPEKRLNQ